jgi:hypothetical protein
MSATIRRPACENAAIGAADQPRYPHEPHEYLPHYWARDWLACPGWTAGEAAALELVDELLGTRHEVARCEIRPFLAAELERLIIPGPDHPTEPLRALFGVPLLQSMAIDGGYRLVRP